MVPYLISVDLKLHGDLAERESDLEGRDEKVVEDEQREVIRGPQCAAVGVAVVRQAWRNHPPRSGLTCRDR